MYNHHALRGGGGGGEGKVSGVHAGTAASKAEEIGGGIELTESEEDMGACSPDPSDKTLESVLKSEGKYFHPGHTNYYEGGGQERRKIRERKWRCERSDMEIYFFNVCACITVVTAVAQTHIYVNAYTVTFT